jgi:hypothetical protein
MSAGRPGGLPPPPLTGEILKLDDLDTGFSPENPKRNRPCVVIGSAGLRVRVVPHSTRPSQGVVVPEGAVEGLREGFFVRFGATVPLSIALSSVCLGQLGEPYLEEVLRQARPWP